MDDQEPKQFFRNTNVTDDDTDADMGLNNYAIFKRIKVSTETQDDISEFTSISGGTQDDH